MTPEMRAEKAATQATCFLLVIVTAALCFVACSTIRPGHVKDRVASFDGAAQTSGMIGFDRDGSAIITGHSRDRYNMLVSLYGATFVVPLKQDAGITLVGLTNNMQFYKIDAEHLVKFAEMNALWKESRK